MFIRPMTETAFNMKDSDSISFLTAFKAIWRNDPLFRMILLQACFYYTVFITITLYWAFGGFEP